MAKKNTNSKANEIIKFQNVKDENDPIIQKYISKARNACKDDIQKFELWIEYLKRNNTFESVCQWFEEARNNHPYPPSLKECKHKIGYIEDYFVFTNNYSDFCSISPLFSQHPLKDSLPSIDIMRKHAEIGGALLAGNFFDWAFFAGFPKEHEIEMLMNLFVFGNIFKDPKQITLLRVLFLIASRMRRYAYKFSDILDMDFKIRDRDQSFLDDSPPTIEEYKMILKWLSSDFFFSISLLNPYENKDKTIEAIKKLIDERRSGLSSSDKRKFEILKSDQFLWPTGNIRVDELERYLKVYDLKRKGKTNKEVAKIIYPEYDLSDADLNATALRYVSRDLSKARKIIKNVEMGYFPGKYQ
jgi:hypothetical protein